MKRLLFLFTLVFFQFPNLYADHYLGGYIRYEYVDFNSNTNANRYRIEVEMYIECDNGTGLELSDFLFTYYSLNEPLNYGSFISGSNSYFIMDLTNLSDTVPDLEHFHWKTSEEMLDVENLNAISCATIPELCITHGTYIDTISVPNMNDTVYLSLWDISLTQAITNMDLGASSASPQGMVVYTTIPPTNQISNPSTFDFIEEPNPVLCLDVRQNISLAISDVGQTTTTYQFIQPLESEFQFVSPLSIYTAVDADFIPPYTFNDPFNLGDSIWIDQSTGTLSIRPNNLGLFYFDILIKAYDDNGNLMYSMNKPFSYFVLDCNTITSNPQITEPDCGEKTITFEQNPSSGLNYNWDFGDGNNSNLSSGTHTYTNFGTYYGNLIVTKGTDCVDTTEFEVSLVEGYDVQLNVNEKSQCITNNNFSFNIQYSNLSSGTTPQSTIYFDSSANLDSSNATTQNNVIYSNAGFHTVYLQTTVDGCTRNDTLEIEVLESPLADFSLEPIEVNIDEAIKIKNLANHYDSLFYIFEGDTIYEEDFEQKVDHLAEGEYSITQFVRSSNNKCFDQKTIKFKVLDYFWIKFPNTITPNGDGLNEYLFATHRNVKGIKYTIANRWGAIIYKDSKMIKDNKWFGYKNNGEKVQAGVYILIADYIDHKGHSHQYKDIINIIY